MVGQSEQQACGPGRQRDVRARVAIVTGGSRGIGAAIALALAGEGATVVAAARDWERLEAVAHAFEEENADPLEQRGSAGSLHPHVVDVTREESVEALVADTVARFGRLDVLVNAAGVLTVAGLTETTAEDWRRTLEVNLTGVFLCTRAAVRQMLEQPPGSDGVRGAIVQIVSGAGTHGWPRASAYTASKFGVMGFSEAIRDEVREHGVKVIDVLPGMVQTAMTDRPEFATRPKLVPDDVAQAVLAALRASPAAMITRIDVRHQSPGH